MNALLQNMIAQLESWEAAVEFGIPENLWAKYDARQRTTDIYTASLSAIFDTIREDDVVVRKTWFDSLAKSFTIYSRSAAIKYIDGFDYNLNQIYCASLYYLADQPATATFLSNTTNAYNTEIEEESFLKNLFSKKLDPSNVLDQELLDALQTVYGENFDDLLEDLNERIQIGLDHNPRQYFASKLASEVIKRFSETNIWSNLRKYTSDYSYEDWSPFFTSSSFSFWELLPSQITALESGILKDSDEPISLQMPTSSGKTALCEILIYNEVKIRNKRVLFLVPYRALAAEILSGISNRLQAAGLSVIASYGGNISTKSEKASIETADVLIVTPEKFSTLIQVVEGLSEKFGTIICDEGQLIDDESRGLSYELLLTKLRATSKKIVFLSAILPNVDMIHGWLGGDEDTLAISDYKPVQTDYAFLTKQTPTSWQLIFNPNYPQPRSFFLRHFLIQDDFRFLNPDTGRNKLIDNWKSFLSLACVSSIKARRNGPVALFTTTRGNNGVNGLANKLLSMYENKIFAIQGQTPLSITQRNETRYLSEYLNFLLGTDYLLSKLVKYNSGFHHGLLPQEIRRVMEEGIENNVILILICTSTLAEGVNLPIRTLVIHTTRRYNPETEKHQYIENRSLKNIIGRAGRAGKETKGRVIFTNENEKEKVLQVLKDQGMENAKGVLFRLIEAIAEHSKKHDIEIGEVLNIDHPLIVKLVENVDYSIFDLLPEDLEAETVPQLIDELIDKTFAKYQSETTEIVDSLKTVFQFRIDKIKEDVEEDQRRFLKKSGSSLKFWDFIQSQGLLQNPIWTELENPLDDDWIEGIIQPLLRYPSIELDDDEIETTIQALSGWLEGKTYFEIVADCEITIDETFEIVGQIFGFKLQSYLSKLSQIYIAKHGEDQISEVAQAWPSLLQYGLISLQQLDLFEKGISDRMAVWGMHRSLQYNEIDYRGRRLLRYIRQFKDTFREILEGDARVPQLCVNRFFNELDN